MPPPIARRPVVVERKVRVWWRREGVGGILIFSIFVGMEVGGG